MPIKLFEKICEEVSDSGCKEINLQGSGEPLLNNNIDVYVSIASKYKMRSSIVTNGFLLTESMSQKLLDCGISDVRVSVIGYDRDTYEHWMSKDAFHTVYDNCKQFLQLQTKGEYLDTELSSYHLILDNTQIEQEVDQYLINWINPLQITAEIWKMHNWGGSYDAPYKRGQPEKRSCGRPFAPYINIRAGGNNGSLGAVVPCCYVLGNDSSAVLGHADAQSLQEIWTSDEYYKLRQAHRKKDFDSIDYCKNCDQLYEEPDSLVWTNVEGKRYGQHKSNQSIDFRSILNDR